MFQNGLPTVRKGSISSPASHFCMCEYHTACRRHPRCVVQLRQGAVRSYLLKAGCRSNGWRKRWAGAGAWAAKMSNVTTIFSLFIKNVHSSFILNSPKLKSIQKSTNRRIDKPIMVYSFNKSSTATTTTKKMEH